MTKYEMQIKIDDKWKSIRPTRSHSPYQYDSEDEAKNMLNLCYPNLLYNIEKKVLKVND